MYNTDPYLPASRLKLGTNKVDVKDGVREGRDKSVSRKTLVRGAKLAIILS